MPLRVTTPAAFSPARLYEDLDTGLQTMLALQPFGWQLTPRFQTVSLPWYFDRSETRQAITALGQALDGRPGRAPGRGQYTFLIDRGLLVIVSQYGLAAKVSRSIAQGVIHDLQAVEQGDPWERLPAISVPAGLPSLAATLTRPRGSLASGVPKKPSSGP